MNIPTKEPHPYDKCKTTKAFIKYQKHRYSFKTNDKLTKEINKPYNSKDNKERIPIGK